MAWDDAPPESKGWDVAPPTADELKPSYLQDVGTNAMREIKALPGSVPTLAKQALGVASAPMDALKAVPQMLGGKNLAETDIAEDVKPIIEGNKGTLNTIEHPVDSFRKAPINTAGTALGLLAGVKGLLPGSPEVPNVPRERIVESPSALQVPESGMASGAKKLPSMPSGSQPPMAENAPIESGSAGQNVGTQLSERLRQAGQGSKAPLPGLPKSGVPSAPSGLPKAPSGGMDVPPTSPRASLPIVQPGLKTGDPHALFAYNDKFGPGGTERSVYNIFGDPEHPALKAKGWGSSIPQEDLGDIPVTGRQPGSERFTPIETKAPASGTPPPAGETIPPSGGTKSPITETIANDAMAKAKEVKDYISKGYEGYAKKPGTASEIADYVQEKSQMMAAQQMGATPLQARQIGHEGMRALGQYALDNDIVGPTTGLKGMRARTNALNEAAGKTIGDIREQADALRVPAEHNVDVLQAVHQKFDPIFSRGTRSGESGAYAKVLEELEDTKPTFQGMSDLSTKLNKAANEANRLNQPHGVYTDIANEVSHLNNERIKALIGPEKAATYEQALRDFGATKKIGEFLKRKEAGEVKRMGPGSLTSNLTQKAMDEFGYRAGAKIANKVSSAIKRNPGITKTIPSLFKEFTNQVEDVSHEVTGMSMGGIVPDDVKRYVQSRAC